MHTTNKNRWYDNHFVLCEYIEGLKDLKTQERDNVISGMRDLIIEHDKVFFDKYLLDFPRQFRYWYYEEPSRHRVMVIQRGR
jgi:hypothetical protein